MAQRSPRKPPPLSDRLGGLIVMVSTFTVIGLAIADFANDGKVDRYWIAALLVISLTFGGYGADKLFGRWFR